MASNGQEKAINGDINGKGQEEAINGDINVKECKAYEINTSDKTDKDFSTKTWKEDLTLIVEGKRMYVARNILALVSPVFTNMFEQEFKEKNQEEIELPGKKYDDVVEFLKCIYPNYLAEVSEENVEQVLPLADEYQVLKLKKKCELVMMDSITKLTSTCDLYRYLTWASRHDLKNLSKKCIMLAAEKTEDELNYANKHVPMNVEQTFEIQKAIISRLRSADDQLKLLKLEPNSSTVEELSKFSKAKGVTIAFTCSVNDITTTNTNESSKHYIWNTAWVVGMKSFEKVSTWNTRTFLSIYLKCYLQESSQNASFETMANIVLKNRFIGKENKHNGIQHTFCDTKTEFGIDQFIAMDELKVEWNGFISEGRTTIDVHVLINPPITHKKTEIKK